MPKYYSTITDEIVDYPADAAALFSTLKPVPSSRKSDNEQTEIKIELTPELTVEKSDDTKKDGNKDAK